MRSEPERKRTRGARRHVLSPAWLAVLIVACSSTSAHVGCDPSLSCSLHPEEFKPAVVQDAGPPPCEREGERCPVAQVAAGGRHSCAVTKAHELYCWGDNSDGQRGDGSALAVDGGALAAADGGASTFVDGGASSAANGGASSAANGGASSAANGGEEAGVSDASLVTLPQSLDASTGLERFVRVAQSTDKISAGEAHTCALHPQGAVRCWGRNAQGQVDGVASGPVRVPVVVALDAVASDLAAGDAHTCVVVEMGVVCWGSARFGQVGRAVQTAPLPPGLVEGTAGAMAVAAGARHSCARLADQHVVCWGELTDPASGKPRTSATAITVPDLDDAAEISAGAGHSCALRRNGDVVCWGQNDSGQLGDGTTHASGRPVRVMGLQPALHVAAGGGEQAGRLFGHSCAIDIGFFVSCWGRNAEGQLGIGPAGDRTTATLVLGRPGELGDPYLRDIVAIEAGARHTCAVDHDGPVVCWGDDSAGQLGAREPHPGFGRIARVERFGR